MEVQLALIQYEVYDSGERMAGTASIDLPEIEFAQTDVKGAGIAGEVSWSVRGNFSNFTSTIHWRTLTESGAKFLNQKRGWMMSFRGAQEAYDAGTGERKVVPVRIDLRCHTNKLTLGKFEPGETVDTELEVMLDYIKISIGGTVVTEIDKFNSRFVVNGEDVLSDVNAALGL